MSGEKDSRKIVSLVIVGVLVTVGMLLYAVWLLFGDKTADQSINQPTVFPESELRSNQGTVDGPSYELPQPSEDQEPIVPETIPTGSDYETTDQDWRDEVVGLPAQQQVGFSSLPASETTVPADEAVVILDSKFDDSSWDPIKDMLDNLPPLYTPKDPPIVTRELYVPPSYPTLQEENFRDCGKMSIPQSSSEEAAFLDSLKDNPAAICLGEAIADNCEASEVRFLQGYSANYIIVAERNDGECGYGLSVDGETVTLCSVEEVMNASLDRSENISYWERFFEEDPGQAFADAYLGGYSASEATIAKVAAGCEMFTLQ